MNALAREEIRGAAFAAALAKVMGGVLWPLFWARRKRGRPMPPDAIDNWDCGDCDVGPSANAYIVMEYREAGRWVPHWRANKLWQAQYEAGRLVMPWRIVDECGHIVDRGHGQAVVVEN